MAAISVSLAGSPAAAAGGDGHFERRQSSHFLLLQDLGFERYSGRGGSRDFERNVLEVLEDAFARVSDLLDLRPRSRIEVRIYAPGAFDDAFSGRFGFSAAGFFDGRIHVRGSEQLDGRLVRTLHHEYAHAAIDAAGGGRIFPGWLNEGLAEYVEHLAVGSRYLGPADGAALVAAREGGYWIPFEELAAPSFVHLRGESAALAYLQSFALVVHLARRYGDRSLRDLCDRLLSSRNPSRAIERTYRKDLGTLARELQSSLR